MHLGPAEAAPRHEETGRLSAPARSCYSHHGCGLRDALIGHMANLGEQRIRWLLAGVGIGSFALLLGLEVVTEGDEISLFDLLVDAVTLLLTISAAVGVALLTQRLQAQHEERMSLIRDLKIARAEGEAWRSRVQANLYGIRIEMENQFQEWGMTAAERDVGLLILKGLNHKEIAALRGTSEATVRQQAQAIYRKADLPGKTAFSAYFLEDLLASDAIMDGRAADSTQGAYPAREPEHTAEVALREPGDRGR
jgi:DNA-binding CsgD family transcriptional regulator